jgi:uncharacterized protein (DUF1501 family)
MAFTPYGASTRGDLLLVLFLRGAADALNVIVPHGEQAYYTMRPTISIGRPDDARIESALRSVDLDGFFGLHPSLAPLLPAWEAGHLAPIHACGAPDDSRSHFKAMELMERGVESAKGPASGWINRHLATFDSGNPSPLRAIGLGEMAPRSLRGAVPVSALRSIADFHLGGNLELASMMHAGLFSLYAADERLADAGQETLEIIETIEKLDPEGYVSSGEVAYPETEFGYGLRQIAMLAKAEVGLEVAAIDIGGWDTHFAQGGSQGHMSNLLTDLGQGLAAIHEDLSLMADRLTVVVMTEFGRRVRENASLGTDHGHGSAMLLLGGHVNGGRVHGSWPGLEVGHLFGPGDLKVTTDYRDVLAEVCLKRLNNPAIAEIFPDYQPQKSGFVR